MDSAMADFLLEIGLEEVPARMLAAAERELGERVVSLLQRERLAGAALRCQTFSTPRRLAVLVHDVMLRQPDAEEQMLGPSWSIAFKDGVPTQAGAAFARKAGIAVEQIQKIVTAKGEYGGATIARPGRPARDVLSELLPKEIASLSWPKAMYWRAGKPERFVRPLQWLLAWLDAEVLPVAFAGVQAGNVSFGHRILHGAAPVTVASPSDYVAALKSAYVTVDVEQRRHTIRKALDRVTRSVAQARWREDEALVDAVTHLTEWPSVVLGSFPQEFLALPEEVLVTVMRDHQKYFALEDTQGKLLPHFLTVLNTEADAVGEATIRHGNERVLRARFSDAQFFWDFDARTSLEQRRAMLEDVTFHKDLGSYAKKTERNLEIAVHLSQRATARGATVLQAVLRRAVELAKVDLTTELVKEFTELQGIVGGLYIRREAAGGQEETEAIAQAVYWQYMPASAADPIPPTVEGQLLGLADRIATVTDLFALGLIPTGSKDPYALRRAASAIIKILAEGKTRLLVPDVIEAASEDMALQQTVAAFLRERLSYYLREAEGLEADVAVAVLAAGDGDIPDAVQRGRALTEVRGGEQMVAIAAAWKRMKNILRQAEEKGLSTDGVVREDLLKDEAEQQLWSNLEKAMPHIEEWREQGEYGYALRDIAALQPQVYQFFDQVMVMVEDAELRANRLALLSALIRQLGHIADFSEIAPDNATGAVTE
jgi:glycyl-tRNA synthetase beta chain